MLLESRAVADVAEPEFASVPEAPAWGTSPPEAVPFSTKEKVKLAVAPAAMSCAPLSAVAEVAAPPVATARGGFGLGRTARAVASPVFATTTTAVKDWPRSRAAGTSGRRQR